MYIYIYCTRSPCWLVHCKKKQPWCGNTFGPGFPRNLGTASPGPRPYGQVQCAEFLWKVDIYNVDDNNMMIMFMKIMMIMLMIMMTMIIIMIMLSILLLMIIFSCKSLWYNAYGCLCTMIVLWCLWMFMTLCLCYYVYVPMFMLLR